MNYYYLNFFYDFIGIPFFLHKYKAENQIDITIL